MTTDELKALLAETTPAPWNWRLEDGPEWFLSPGVLKVEGGMTDGTPMGDAIDRANARLIALAPDLLAEVIALREQNARLVGALTPSIETKSAYMGEFSLDIPDYDEDGNEVSRRVMVPWTTIKEIMTAIRAHSALAEIEKEGGE